MSRYNDQLEDELEMALGRARAAEAELAKLREGAEPVSGTAIFGSGKQAAVYDLFRANPDTRGDHHDYYRCGLSGIMRPERGTTAYAAWLAGNHAAASHPARADRRPLWRGNGGARRMSTGAPANTRSEAYKATKMRPRCSARSPLRPLASRTGRPGGGERG